MTICVRGFMVIRDFRFSEDNKNWATALHPVEFLFQDDKLAERLSRSYYAERDSVGSVPMAELQRAADRYLREVLFDIWHENEIDKYEKNNYRVSFKIMDFCLPNDTYAKKKDFCTIIGYWLNSSQEIGYARQDNDTYQLLLAYRFIENNQREFYGLSYLDPNVEVKKQKLKLDYESRELKKFFNELKGHLRTAQHTKWHELNPVFVPARDSSSVIPISGKIISEQINLQEKTNFSLRFIQAGRLFDISRCELVLEHSDSMSAEVKEVSAKYEDSVTLRVQHREGYFEPVKFEVLSPINEI